MATDLRDTDDSSSGANSGPAVPFLSDDQFSWRAATAGSVTYARQYVRGVLTEMHAPPAAVNDAVLLTSELVTNVVEHTNSTIVGVAATVTPDRVQVTVRGSDPATRPPRPEAPAPASPDAAGGRGLVIVDALADDWGVGRQPGKPETWFALNTKAGEDEPDLDEDEPTAPVAGRGRTIGARLLAPIHAAMGRRGSLWRRIAILVAAVLVVVIAGGLTLAIGIGHANDVTARRTALGRAVLHTVDVEVSVVDQETSLRGFLLSNKPSFLSPYAVATRNWNKNYGAIVKDIRLADDKRIVREDTLAIGRLHQRWINTVARRELALARKSLPAAQRVEASGAGKSLVDAMRLRIADLLQRSDAARTAELRHEESLRNWVTGVGASFAMLLLILIIAVAFAARRLIMEPVRELSTAARAVAAGKRDEAVSVHGPQEIRSVASDVESMRAELLQRIREQEHLIAGLQQHSPTVASLRAALGTVPTHLPRLAIAAHTLAGDGVLSGDWYDVIRLNEGRVAITLGDVAGHGPASAVTALAVKHALAAMLSSGCAADDAIESATGVITSSGMTTPGLASVFIAILDPNDHSLTYVNAGHPPAFVWNPFSRDMQKLTATGPILSRLTAKAQRQVRRCPYGPNAVLAVYSDGLTEASPAGKRDEYGDGRLYDTLARLFGQNDPLGFLDDHAQLEQIVTATFTAVADHARILTDDATLLVARHVANDALHGGPRRAAPN